jgi:hypothetical protein
MGAAILYHCCRTPVGPPFQAGRDPGGCQLADDCHLAVKSAMIFPLPPGEGRVRAFYRDTIIFGQKTTRLSNLDVIALRFPSSPARFFLYT